MPWQHVTIRAAGGRSCVATQEKDLPAGGRTSIRTHVALVTANEHRRLTLKGPLRCHAAGPSKYLGVLLP